MRSLLDLGPKKSPPFVTSAVGSTHKAGHSPFNRKGCSSSGREMPFKQAILLRIICVIFGLLINKVI